MSLLKRILTIDVCLLTVALACGTTPNWQHLVADTLGIDEHVSFWIADNSSPSTLLDRSFQYAATPPLSFLLQRLSLEIFGREPWALRVPAAASYLASIVLVWWLGRSWLTPLAGGIASVLFATHAAVLDFAAAGRPYSLGWLLSLWAMQSTRRLREMPGRPLNWLWWTLANLALVQTHYLFAGLWAAEFLWLVLGTQPPRLSVRLILAAGAILSGCVLSAVPGLLRVWEHRAYLNWTTRVPEPADLLALTLPIQWGWFRQPVWCGVMLLPIVWQLAARRFRPRDWFDVERWRAVRGTLPLLIVWFAVPMAGIWIAGRWWLPSLAAARYMAIYTVGFVLLLGGILSLLRGNVAPAIAAAALLLLQGFVPRFVQPPRWVETPAASEWHKIAGEVSDLGDDVRLVLVGSGLTEMWLVPAYADDPVFHDYVSCRLGRIYLGNDPSRLALPMRWTDKMPGFYRRQIAQACRPGNAAGADAPRHRDANVCVAVATDTDLLRESARRMMDVFADAGFIERHRVLLPNSTLVVFSCSTDE